MMRYMLDIWTYSAIVWLQNTWVMLNWSNFIGMFFRNPREAGPVPFSSSGESWYRSVLANSLYMMWTNVNTFSVDMTVKRWLPNFIFVVNYSFKLYVLTLQLKIDRESVSKKVGSQRRLLELWFRHLLWLINMCDWKHKYAYNLG